MKGITFKVLSVAFFPLFGVVILALFGGVALLSLQSQNSEIVDTGLVGIIDNKIIPMLNDEILPAINDYMVPLIDEKMLPLINNDIKYQLELLTAIQLILEVDRDVHKSLVLEKRSFSVIEEDMPAIRENHALNIDRAEQKLSDTLQFMSGDKTSREIYSDTSVAFKKWIAKTNGVLEKVMVHSKRKFALKASNGGSAEKSFTHFRNLLNKLQKRAEHLVGEQQKLVAHKRTTIQISREVVLSKNREILASRVEIEGASASATNLSNELKNRVRTVVTAFITVALVTLLVSVTAAILIGKKISKPVIDATNFAHIVGKGDLTSRLHVNRNDEIGKLLEALDSMVDNLAEKALLAEKISQKDLTGRLPLKSDKDSLGVSLVRMTKSLNLFMANLRSVTDTVRENSHQVSGASTDLSQGAAEQAASLEEISSSMEEIRKQVVANANSAGKVNALAESAVRLSEGGNKQMALMLSAMNTITTSSKQISRIIKVIDDIAFQTNLLALNAAVEAARAGIHGKGFAVVAEEVRTLATRSAKAASESNDLIEDSVKSIEHGSSIVQITSASFKKIYQQISEANDLMTEMAESATNQAASVSQITEGINQVGIVTQTNTVNADKTAKAALELADQARTLSNEISKYSIKDDFKELSPLRNVERSTSQGQKTKTLRG